MATDKDRERRRRNRPKDRQRQKARMRERVAVVNKLKDVPCMDCGVKYPPHVMDFDHRLGVQKLSGISDLVGKDCRIERIKAEIAKCDVVCANCHRERTHQRKMFE